MFHSVLRFVVSLLIAGTIMMPSAVAGVGSVRRMVGDQGTQTQPQDLWCPQTLFTQTIAIPVVCPADAGAGEPDAQFVLSLCDATPVCAGGAHAYIAKSTAVGCVPMATAIAPADQWQYLTPLTLTATYTGSMLYPDDTVFNVTVSCDPSAELLVPNGDVKRSLVSGTMNATSVQVWKYDMALRSRHACPRAPPQPVVFVSPNSDDHSITPVELDIPAGGHQYVVIQPGANVALDAVITVDSGGAVCSDRIYVGMSRGTPPLPYSVRIPDAKYNPSAGYDGGEPAFDWNRFAAALAGSTLCDSPKQLAITVSDTGSTVPPPLQLNSSSTAAFAWDVTNGETNVTRASKLIGLANGTITYYLLAESRLDPRQAPTATCRVKIFVTTHNRTYLRAGFVLMFLSMLPLVGVFIAMVRRSLTARRFVARIDAPFRPPDFPSFSLMCATLPFYTARILVLWTSFALERLRVNMGSRSSSQDKSYAAVRRGPPQNGDEAGRHAPHRTGVNVGSGAPLSSTEMSELHARSSLDRFDESAGEVLSPSATHPPPPPPPPPPPAPRGSSPEANEPPLCRICKEGEEGEALIAPCHCTGSIRFIHASCLSKWRVQSARGNARFITHCEICQSPFDTRLVPQPSVTNVLLAKYGFLLLTLVVFWLMTLFAGLFVVNTASQVACAAPWHQAWDSFGGVAFVGLASYMVVCIIVYTAAWGTDREAQALAFATRRPARPMTVADLAKGAAPRVAFVVALMTVIGFVWEWFFYFTTDEVAWTSEWRGDAGFYSLFFPTFIGVSLSDLFAGRPEDDRRPPPEADPQPLLDDNTSGAAERHVTVNMSADPDANGAPSAGVISSHGSPLVPLGPSHQHSVQRTARTTTPPPTASRVALPPPGSRYDMEPGSVAASEHLAVATNSSIGDVSASLYHQGDAVASQHASVVVLTGRGWHGDGGDSMHGGSDDDEGLAGGPHEAVSR